MFTRGGARKISKVLIPPDPRECLFSFPFFFALLLLLLPFPSILVLALIYQIYGPKGVGALYVRRRPRVRLEPIFSGGGQERVRSPIHFLNYVRVFRFCSVRRWYVDVTVHVCMLFCASSRDTVARRKSKQDVSLLRGRCAFAPHGSLLLYECLCEHVCMCVCHLSLPEMEETACALLMYIFPARAIACKALPSRKKTKAKMSTLSSRYHESCCFIFSLASSSSSSSFVCSFVLAIGFVCLLLMWSLLTFHSFLPSNFVTGPAVGNHSTCALCWVRYGVPGV